MKWRVLVAVVFGLFIEWGWEVAGAVILSGENDVAFAEEAVCGVVEEMGVVLVEVLSAGKLVEV